MMTRLWSLALLAVLALGAQTKAPAAKERPKRSAAAKPAAAEAKSAPVNQPAQPPKGAVEIEEGLWRWVDAKGVEWHYRRTPFGFSRYQPSQIVRENDDEEQAQWIVAADGGDVVHFERTTPFGKAKWSKKKTELTAVEALAWKRAQKNKESAGTKPAQE